MQISGWVAWLATAWCQQTCCKLLTDIWKVIIKTCYQQPCLLQVVSSSCTKSENEKLPQVWWIFGWVANARSLRGCWHETGYIAILEYKVFTIYGVSMVLCFVKILYSSCIFFSPTNRDLQKVQIDYFSQSDVLDLPDRPIRF